MTTGITPGDCCAALLFLKPVELSPSTWTSSCCKRVASPEEIEAFWRGSRSPQGSNDHEHVQGLNMFKS